MTTDPRHDRHGPFWEIGEDGVGWVTFNDPERKVNVLTEGVMRRLGELLEEVRGDIATGRVRVVVFRSGKDNGFIAGADVAAIADVESPEEGAEGARLGQSLFREVEQLQVPTVAAVHGACMGGGVELSLACRYRVASDAPSTAFALPEVQLGILPAWGGTTRLPRLIGLQGALSLLLTGKKVDARRARRLGLIEEVIPAEFFMPQVHAFALARIDGRIRTGAKRAFLKRLAEDSAPGRKVILAAARKRVMKETGGHYPAPLKILDVLESSLGRSLDVAFSNEADAAGELIATPVSKNLLHLFHLREAARRRSVDAEPLAIAALGVIGAGVMGGGVAQLAAYNGIRVRIKDIRHDAVAQALQHARTLFEKGVERRKLDRLDAARRMELISGGIEFDGFGRLDLVVEAVVERMDVKRTVLAEAESHLPPSAILTTNTSTLSIDEMAEVLQRPEHFLGMHFFNPVHRMPLIEIIRGARTGDGAVATVHALALRMGKTPVIVRDGPGFLVNRILAPYMNEAGYLLADGVSVEAIDSAAKAFGMPMGPLRLIDEVGVDVSRHAGTVLHEAFGDRLAPAPPLVALGETDRLGRKGGVGFYLYEKGREKEADPGIYAALNGSVPASRTRMTEESIRTRLVLSMMNEAARVLEDGIVERAGDVDLAMIMGTGFPPFRGGLLRFADSLHPRLLLDRFREHEQRFGGRFAPAPLVVRLAEEDRGFYEAFP